MSATLHSTEGSALYMAVIDCPHSIEDKKIVLRFDPSKPGHNALNQLGTRLDSLVAGSGWQPIETAPKDRDVLLYCKARGVVRGCWEDCYFARKPRPYWTNDREALFGVSGTRNDQPTHWMPLPPAPNQGEPS